jgi:hypothetical protein
LPVSHLVHQLLKLFFSKVGARSSDSALDIAADPVPSRHILARVDRIDAKLPLSFHNPPRNKR